MRHAGRRYRFATYEFDVERSELRRDGTPVELTRQASELLSYLIEHRERAVSRDELFDGVWGSVAVSDGALSTAIYELRAALGDDGRRQHIIRTLRGRGFRFAAAVDEVGPAARHDVRSDTPLAPRQTPFVGRTAVLERLDAALADAARGVGRVVLLEGEAGIGKTSVVQHLATLAAARTRVLWGRCWEHAGAPPFWPWMQILRAPIAETPAAALRRLFGASAAQLAAALPELRAAVPRSRDRTVSAAEQRFQMFHGVTALLAETAAREPLLLVIDDLHFADQPSLLLLEFLAGEIAAAGVLVVGTYRSEEIGEAHPLVATLARLARTHAVRVALRGLDRDEVRELIATLTGVGPPPGVVDRILSRTEGNPLFVKELVRDVRGPEADAWARVDAGLPQPVEEVIRRRLERLPGATREALSVAAVLGRDFRLDLLARTWDGPAPLGTAWLDDAVRAQVVIRLADGRGRFAHALFQEAFSSRLDAARRAAIHRRAAEALEGGVPCARGTDLAVIAYHWNAALAGGGDPARAIRSSVVAARAASEMLAYEEAVEHARRALEALAWDPSPAPSTRAELLLGLAEATEQAGDAVAAREHFAAAARVASQGGCPGLLARAALGFAAARDHALVIEGDAREAARRREAASLLSEALATLGEGDVVLRTRAMAALALVADGYPAEERDRLSRAALAEATRRGTSTLLAEAVAARRELLWSPDNVEERLEMSTSIVRLAERTGAREQELRGRAWRLTDLLELGSLAQVRGEMETCDRLAIEIGQLKYQHLVTVLRGTLAFLAGRFDEAEQLADAALAIGRRMRFDRAELLHLVHLTSIRREQGGLEAFEPQLRAMEARVPIHAVRCMLAYQLGEMLRLDEARARYDELAACSFADVPRDRNYLCSLMLLANLSSRLRDRRGAAALYRLMLPFAERNVVVAEGIMSLGSVSVPLGLVATVLGRFDDAERHFERAIVLDERVGAHAFVGQTARAYGEMLLERDRPGDRARALALLDRAWAIADRFGSYGLQRRVETIRACARRSPRPAAPPA